MKRSLFSSTIAVPAAAIMAALLLAPVSRAAGPLPRTRGVITAINGDSVTVKTRFAGTITLKLSDKTNYVGADKTTLAEVKPGGYVGVAAIPGPNGTLTAEEITIFAEGMRGSGEGHYGWDLGKSSSMTNGTVGTITAADKFGMTVSYKGGEKKLMVPNDVPVVDVEPGARSLLKPGAHVVALGAKAGDGSVNAIVLIVGKDDTVPPM